MTTTYSPFPPTSEREQDYAHITVRLLRELQRHDEIYLMDFPFGDDPVNAGSHVTSYDVVTLWSYGQQFRIESVEEPILYGSGENKIARCYPLRKADSD